MERKMEGYLTLGDNTLMEKKDSSRKTVLLKISRILLQHTVMTTCLAN